MGFFIIMGKTWKKKKNHIGHIGNYRGKGDEYGHNWRPNSYRNALREFTDGDEEMPKMRPKSLPPSPYEDQQAIGRIKPDESRFNFRSMTKEKEKRRIFEELY